MAIKLGRFEDWMEPEDVIPYANREALEGYLIFINKGHLIPYIDRLRKNVYMSVSWAINNDLDLFVNLYREFQYTPHKNELYIAIQHYYNRDIGIMTDSQPTISNAPFSNLRRLGDQNLINEIIDLEYYPATWQSVYKTMSIFGNHSHVDELLNRGADISYVAANRPDIYHHYFNNIRLTSDVILTAVRYGYYEVIESILPQYISDVDELVRQCLRRRYDQFRVLKLIISRHRTPKIIDVSDFRFLEKSSVEFLHTRGYEINPLNNGVFTYSPESALFMKDNYRNVNIIIPQIINTSPNKFIHALELLYIA